MLVSCPLQYIEPFTGVLQKQSSRCDLQKSCSETFQKSLRKTPITEISTLNSTPSGVLLCELAKSFQNNFFSEHLQIAVILLIKDYPDIISIIISQNVMYTYWNRFCKKKTKCFEEKKTANDLKSFPIFFSYLFF